MTMLFSQSAYVQASDLLEAFLTVAATTVGAVVAFAVYALVLVTLHVTKVVSHFSIFVGDFLDLLADELIVCIYKKVDAIAEPSHSNIIAKEEDASISLLPEHNTHIAEPVDAPIAPEPVQLLVDADAQTVVAKEPAATESVEKVQPVAEAVSPVSNTHVQENNIEEIATVDSVPVAAAPAHESEDIAEEPITETPSAPEPVQLFADTHAQENHMEEPAAANPVSVAAVEPEIGAEELQAAAAVAPEPVPFFRPRHTQEIAEERAAVDEIIEEPAVVEAATEAAMEEPAAEAAMEEPADEPIIEQPAVADAVIEESAAAETAIEDPVMVEPVVDEPLAIEPAAALPTPVPVILLPHAQEIHAEELATADSTVTESAPLDSSVTPQPFPYTQDAKSDIFTTPEQTIENSPLNHIQNHIDKMEVTALASIFSPAPLSVELTTSETASADDAVSKPVHHAPFLVQESCNKESAVNFATAVVFGPAPKTHKKVNYPPLREGIIKESQAMVPVNYASQRIANQYSVMKVAEVFKLRLNSIHNVEAPKGVRSSCMVMAPRRYPLSEMPCHSVPLLKEDIESEQDSKGHRTEEAVVIFSQPPTGKDAPVGEKPEAARTSRPAAHASHIIKTALFKHLERASVATTAAKRKGCDGAQSQPLAPLPMKLSNKTGENKEGRQGVCGEDSSSPRSSAPSSGRGTPSPTKKGVKVVQSSAGQRNPAANASSKKKQEKRVLTPAEKKQNAKFYYNQRHKSG